ncbi:MAG: glycosyltransferase family protein [Myxococcota bacterium]
MSTIHLYVHGRGWGHGQRSEAVCEHLRSAGYSVRVFAGRGALDAFAPGDAEPVESLMPRAGWRTLPLLRRRVSKASRLLNEEPPAAVVSDGDLPAVLAARLRGIPSVALGHGLIFSHTQRPQALPALPWLREAAKARIASMGTTRQVAVSFTRLTPRSATTTIARPTLRHALRSPRTPGEHLVCYFRDPNCHDVVRALRDQGQPIRLFSSEDPKLSEVAWEPPDAVRFAEALLSARAVVSSAGSQLIGECLTLGIPQLSLYDANDDEQRLNVALLKAHSLGTGCTLDTFNDATASAFLTSLDKRPPQSPPEPWGPEAGDAVQQALDAIVARRG